MNTTSIGVMLAMLTGVYAHAASAQDYNYVPGWANTTNHQYKSSGAGGEWQAKTDLFKALGARGAAAQCTLKQLSEPEGNTLVNRYRSQARKTSEAAALQWAHAQVEEHHRRLKARGIC